MVYVGGGGLGGGEFGGLFGIGGVGLGEFGGLFGLSGGGLGLIGEWFVINVFYKYISFLNFVFNGNGKFNNKKWIFFLKLVYLIMNMFN